ncbi:FkbM family methyltransferase [Saccharolobus islandicus]|uniref:FkbM family methyltransferase n=1 Tax=Saccharolobus islandicus TaxID=43080 RepID=UPI0003799EA9|nr:FkbM family methyltransferase [Sulfolobus islandicus]
MKLSHLKELKNIRKLNNFFDNTYSAILQYIEKKPLITLKIEGHTIKVSRRLFEQLAYYILRDKISKIEILNDQMLINKEIRIFSCTNADEPYFDDNLLLALDLSDRAKKLGWKFENGLWTNGKVKFLVMLGLIMETFNYNIYYVDGVKDRDVVDIGGSIGDTALYYKINGARNVVSLEPLKLSYNLAKRHLELNNIDHVNFIRGAVVIDKKESVKVPSCYPLYGSGAFSLVKQEYKGEEEVPTFTLSEILPDDPYILKMDCEGCEYNIVLKDYNILKNLKL